MGHSLVKGLNIPSVVKMIEKEYHITENEALALFYKSRIAELYADDDSGLYGQSPNYIFSLFKNDCSNP